MVCGGVWRCVVVCVVCVYVCKSSVCESSVCVFVRVCLVCVCAGAVCVCVWENVGQTGEENSLERWRAGEPPILKSFLVLVCVYLFGCTVCMYVCTDVDKIVGTLPLKEEKATMVTEIT